MKTITEVRNEMFAADVRIARVKVHGNKHVRVTPLSALGTAWVDAVFPGNQASDWAYGGLIVVEDEFAPLCDKALDAGLTVESIDNELPARRRCHVRRRIES